jgi:hypothetical protein
MKKLIMALTLSMTFVFNANAVVWLVPLPEVFLALMGAGGIAAMTADDNHDDFGIAKEFYYDTRRLKQIMAWPESYEKGEGLYTRVEANLLEFRSTVIDLFGEDTVIEKDPTLMKLLKYGDDYRSISLKDFTVKAHSKKTISELLGKDKPNYRQLAQFAYTLTQFCRWNRDECVTK